ncbi:MAG: glycosyltransferase family 4 protein [Planctomycetales bacterium]|nr:glycosyltransferase family 4 protein [Planctomycetales bacterium]
MKQRTNHATPIHRAAKRCKTKVVHVTTIASSLEFLRGQIEFMKQHGFEAEVIASPGSDLDEFAESTQVSAFAVEMPRRVSPLRDLCSLRIMWQHLRSLRPDIVHSHTPKGGMLGMVASWLARVPVRVYHIHGLPLITATGIQRLLLKLSEWTACMCATSVLCVSRSVREVAVAEKLCPPEKIKVLLAGSIMGVDAEGFFDPSKVPCGTAGEVRARYGIPPEAPIVGFVGRMVRDKGIVELMDAWKELRETFPELHLLMVGPDDARDALPLGILEHLQSDPRVHLTGFASPLPMYATMDLLVLPTYREGLPTVVLEASAMELPVVATEVTGCVDAVEDGVTGTLVPAHDAESLRIAISAYLESAELRRKHGRAGRDFVLQYFQPRAVWNAMLGEYRDLIRKAGGALTEDAPVAETVIKESVR